MVHKIKEALTDRLTCNALYLLRSFKDDNLYII